MSDRHGSVRELDLPPLKECPRAWYEDVQSGPGTGIVLTGRCEADASAAVIVALADVANASVALVRGVEPVDGSLLNERPGGFASTPGSGDGWITLDLDECIAIGRLESGAVIPLSRLLLLRRRRLDELPERRVRPFTSGASHLRLTGALWAYTVEVTVKTGRRW